MATTGTTMTAAFIGLNKQTNKLCRHAEIVKTTVWQRLHARDGEHNRSQGLVLILHRCSTQTRRKRSGELRIGCACDPPAPSPRSAEVISSISGTCKRTYAAIKLRPNTSTHDVISCFCATVTVCLRIF